MRSDPAGNATAPNDAKSTVSKRLPGAVGSVGASRVSVSARAFDVFRVVSVSAEASPILNCVVGGAHAALAVVATTYGTVTVAATDDCTVRAVDADTLAVFVTGTPLYSQSGDSDAGTVRFTWIE